MFSSLKVQSNVSWCAQAECGGCWTRAACRCTRPPRRARVCSPSPAPPATTSSPRSCSPCAPTSRTAAWRGTAPRSWRPPAQVKNNLATLRYFSQHLYNITFRPHGHREAAHRARRGCERAVQLRQHAAHVSSEIYLHRCLWSKNIVHGK